MKNNKNLKRFDCRGKSFVETSKKSKNTSKKFYSSYKKDKEKLIYDKTKTPMDKTNFALSYYSKNTSKDINSFNTYTGMYSKCDRIKNN